MLRWWGESGEVIGVGVLYKGCARGGELSSSKRSVSYTLFWGDHVPNHGTSITWSLSDPEHGWDVFCRKPWWRSVHTNREYPLQFWWTNSSPSNSSASNSSPLNSSPSFPLTCHIFPLIASYAASSVSASLRYSASEEIHTLRPPHPASCIFHLPRPPNYPQLHTDLDYHN